MTLYRIFQLGSWLLTILRLAILLQWFLRLFRVNGSFAQWLETLLGPIMAPFRKLAMMIISRTGIGIDFSYVFALLALTIVERLWMLLYRLFR